MHGTPTPNTGSVARDHLANERTYLAWLRTGISVAAVGVAVAKFAPNRGANALVAGLILVIAGILVAAYGAVHYRTVERHLNEGVFIPASFGAIVIATVALMLGLVAVLVLI
ncbi:DUF202 domain-containing protein [Skermania sp. ID1734]|nr:DUF202 domain-containing protein [Skermania sp. ID1734]